MNAPTDSSSKDASERAIDDGLAIAKSLRGTPLEARAEAVVAKLVERFPKAARVHLAQADMWRRAGRIADAGGATQRALACDPQNAEGLRLAAALRGEVLSASDIARMPAPLHLSYDFLDVATHRQLLDLALGFEQRLAPSGVGGISPHANWRRSKVDLSAAPFRALAIDPILDAARSALRAFTMPEFSFDTVEMQFTAHNDGDFYKAHQDYGAGGLEHRRLSFVYYFHRLPRAFSGGGLALYDSIGDEGQYNPQRYSLVEPTDNTLIIFPATFWHEVQKVTCPNGAYGDGRFTLNGWIGVPRLKEAQPAA